MMFVQKKRCVLFFLMQLPSGPVNNKNTNAHSDLAILIIKKIFFDENRNCNDKYQNNKGIKGKRPWIEDHILGRAWPKER